MRAVIGADDRLGPNAWVREIRRSGGGELRAFWVAEDDTTLVTDDEVEAYLRK